MTQTDRKQIAAVLLSLAGMGALFVAVMLSMLDCGPGCCLAVGSVGGGTLLAGTLINARVETVPRRK